LNYNLKFWQGLKEFFKLKEGPKTYQRFPSLPQWRQFFNVLSKKEKIWFFVLFSLAIISGIFLNLNFYFKNTEIAPAFGGVYQEGVIGQPRFINPLYLSTQDVDRDLVELLFSGLMKYNEKGELVKDLAKDYTIKEDGKIFEVQLRDNVYWHDGKPLGADDVVFTIKLIQDPQYQSPLRIKWLGINVEKISENKVRFKLPKKYSGFLEDLTLKIVPKHIFKDLSPKNLPWSLISPNYLVGSGPFKFKELVQDKSGHIKKLTLERNKNYYGKKPYLGEISFLFYQNEDELLKATRIGEIQGFSLTDPKYLKDIKENDLKVHLLSLPRYFAVFFNLKEKNEFSEKNLREALAISINKNEILQNIFSGKGEKVDSPILPKFFNFHSPSKIYDFDIEKAKELLEKEGFKINPQTGKREKIVSQEIPPLFKRNLVYGSKGEDVKELQKCLAKDPKVYPEGKITGFFGKKTKAAVIRFQEKYASEILEPIGLKKGTGEVKAMTRKKLNQICQEAPKKIIPLKFTLTTVDKFPLAQIAEILKKNWQDIGAEVEVKKVSLSEFQTDVLAKRNFELLLFGEALGSIPDPFPFWHSSQKEYPGLNVSGYQSKEADKLLEKARETLDPKERKESLEKFQDVLLQDLPSIFLVRGDYLYFLSSKIKGYSVKKITEPAKRFSGIENWFIKTKRVWK
jgi:ABC-type transport system substrate-binding protein